MAKLFLNVLPRRLNEVIDKEVLKASLETGVVSIPKGYNCNYENDCEVFQQAVYLRNFLDWHGVDVAVGLTCAPNEMYPGWQLIIDTRNYKGSFNAIVSRFFTWSGVENQHILDFDELVNDEWC